MMDSVGGNDFLKRLWIDNGGDKTLRSFGIGNYSELDEDSKAFFEATPHYLVHENFIFVHAGLNLQIENPFEDKHAMLWIRDFEASEFLDNRILVHGHTPIKIEAVRAQLPANIINIDGGCVYSKIEGYGNLVGYSITDQKFISVRNRDL
jgi:serine/threonine protein phosphatase 1